MSRGRIEREVSSGEAQWQRGSAIVPILFLCSISELVRCNGRFLHGMSVSRRLGEGTTAAPLPSAQESSSGRTRLEDIWWIFLVVPAFFVSLVFFTMACVRYHVARRRKMLQSKGVFYNKSPWKTGLSRTMRRRLKKVSITELPLNTREKLERECEEFSNIIGSSSDSVVFKGTRDSGAQIAVARVRIPPSRWTANSELHFLRKVQDLARMKHANIVNLLAYCAEDEPFERMLVFEYAPNGTVHDHLHSPGSPADFLDWSTRMKIVMGAAYGLNYMHTEISPPATHLKFDAHSVYLTEGFTAKVAAYGLSRLCVGNNSLGRRESFGRIVKAIGYDDWEKYRHVAKPESNVWSFGLFMLEMISGRFPYDIHEGSILAWASDYMAAPEKYWKLVDSSLASHDGEQLAALIAIVRSCTHPKPGKRPSMAKVVEKLAAALKMSKDDAALGSSGKIDYKSSPLMWAKLELLTSEVGLNSPEGDGEVVSSSTFPLLAGPSSPKSSPKSGGRSPKTLSAIVGSSSSSNMTDSHPLGEVAVTITSSQVKQFHQSDSKSFER